MLQRHQLEIDRLHGRPNHPILLQRRPICALQLFLGIGSLHVRHTTQKEKQISRSEDGLIDQDPGGDGSIDALKHDILLKEPKPQCCARAEDRFEQASVQSLHIKDRLWEEAPPP